jgi:hypothetical protein
MLEVALGAACFAFVTALVLWIRARTEAAHLKGRIATVLDAEAEARKIRSETTAFADTTKTSALAEAARVKAEAETVAQRTRERAEAEALSTQAAAKSEVARLERVAQGLEQDIPQLRKRVELETAQIREKQRETQLHFEAKRQEWETSYGEAMRALTSLRKDVEVLSEQAEIQSFGLYKPRYEFATSDLYKDRLDGVRERQKTMVKGKTAAICATTWTVGNSAVEGQRMVDRQLKLMLRAFNGECDAAVANVTWKNVTTMNERIGRAFDAINKLGETVQCSISKAYSQLKLDELALAFEYAEKLQKEKEEARRKREEQREEEKAAREIEKAQEEATREEDKYQEALKRAQADAAIANAKERAELDAKMAKIEALLVKAKEKKQRAIAQAEVTRAGYVYVISNDGAFGQNVFKVGLTRRVDPMDRVLELGDASVPFRFDVHAIIWSEDAPALESKIHDALAPHQVNLVNDRKEFFRVPLERIQDLVRKHHGPIEWQRPEAVEYRKTLAIRAEREAAALGITIQVPTPEQTHAAEFEALRARLGKPAA